MKVSSTTILICTYNRAPLLHETLAAMQEMDQPEDCAVDIIVVDNNSTDDTARVVTHAARNARFPITLLQERQQGKSFALNTGLAASSGDLLALTDDDVLPATDWLARIVEAFRARDVTFVFGKVLPRWTCAPPPELLTRQAQAIWGPLAIVDYGDEPALYEPHSAGQRLPIGANLAFRRAALVTIGGWRTDLGKVNNTLISGEDHEIFTRLRRQNLYCGYYDPDNFVRHYVPAARLTRKYFRRWFYWSGRTHALMLDALYPELNMSTVPRIGGVPRFACRQALHQAWRYMTTRRSDALSAMVEEVRLMQYFGLFVECWRRRKRLPPRGKAASAVTALLLAVCLQFHDGLVTLVARGATLQEILAEWSRVGGTRVDNALAAPAGPLNIQLDDVSEAQALQILFRAANVVVVARSGESLLAAGTAHGSSIERIVIAPASNVANLAELRTSASPANLPAPPPSAPNVSEPANALVHPIIGLNGLPIPDDQQ